MSSKRSQKVVKSGRKGSLSGHCEQESQILSKKVLHRNVIWWKVEYGPGLLKDDVSVCRRGSCPGPYSGQPECTKLVGKCPKSSRNVVKSGQKWSDRPDSHFDEFSQQTGQLAGWLGVFTKVRFWPKWSFLSVPGQILDMTARTLCATWTSRIATC